MVLYLFSSVAPLGVAAVLLTVYFRNLLLKLDAYAVSFEHLAGGFHIDDIFGNYIGLMNCSWNDLRYRARIMPSVTL
jgi:hypothetical protein